MIMTMIMSKMLNWSQNQYKPSLIHLTTSERPLQERQGLEQLSLQQGINLKVLEDKLNQGEDDVTVVLIIINS